MPLSVIKPSTAVVSAILTDRIGTPQVATSATKTTVWICNYQPFGSCTPTASVTMNLRLPGMYNDFTVMNHNGFRDFLIGGTSVYSEFDPLDLRLQPFSNGYNYANQNPFKYVDPWGLATLQIGFAGSISTPFGPAFPIGFGIAIDTSLGHGLYGYAGLGSSIGPSADAGLSIQVSNARYITDLSGPFYNFSGHGGAGFGGSLDAFWGPSDNGPVEGGGFTLGAGLGASAFGGRTFTVVAPSQPNPIFAINPPQQPSIAPPSNSIAPSSNNSMPCQVGQAQ
jgi:RHS repeat-associated protein